jgi:opacity protein-like surface antigen
VGGLSASFFLPFGDRNGARGYVSANAGLGYQLMPWLKPEFELNYFHEFVHGQKNGDSVAATVGLILNLSDALRLDLGFRHDFYGRNTDRRLNAIASILWTF